MERAIINGVLSWLIVIGSDTIYVRGYIIFIAESYFGVQNITACNVS